MSGFYEHPFYDTGNERTRESMHQPSKRGKWGGLLLFLLISACLAHGGLEISDLVLSEREIRANGSPDYIHWTAFWDDRDGNYKA